MRGIRSVQALTCQYANGVTTVRGINLSCNRYEIEISGPSAEGWNRVLRTSRYEGYHQRDTSKPTKEK